MNFKFLVSCFVMLLMAMVQNVQSRAVPGFGKMLGGLVAGGAAVSLMSGVWGDTSEELDKEEAKKREDEARRYGAGGARGNNQRPSGSQGGHRSPSAQGPNRQVQQGGQNPNGNAQRSQGGPRQPGQNQNTNGQTQQGRQRPSGSSQNGNGRRSPSGQSRGDNRQSTQNGQSGNPTGRGQGRSPQSGPPSGQRSNGHSPSRDTQNGPQGGGRKPQYGDTITYV